jgi:hypothetical protein
LSIGARDGEEAMEVRWENGLRGERGFVVFNGRIESF